MPPVNYLVTGGDTPDADDSTDYMLVDDSGYGGYDVITCVPAVAYYVIHTTTFVIIDCGLGHVQYCTISQ